MEDLFSDSLVDRSGVRPRWSSEADDHVSLKRGAVIVIDPVIYEDQVIVKQASEEIESKLADLESLELLQTWRALLVQPPLPAGLTGRFLFTTRDDLYQTEFIQSFDMSFASWKVKVSGLLQRLAAIGLIKLLVKGSGQRPTLWHLPWPFSITAELSKPVDKEQTSGALQLNLVDEQGDEGLQLWDTMYQVMSHVLPVEGTDEDGKLVKKYEGSFEAFDYGIKQHLTTKFSTRMTGDFDASVMTVEDRAVLAVIDMMCWRRIQSEIDFGRTPVNDFTLQTRDLAKAIGYRDINLGILTKVTAVVQRILWTQTHAKTEIDVDLADDVSPITKAALNGLHRSFESPRWGTAIREGREVYEYVQFSLENRKFQAMVDRSRNDNPKLGDIPRLVTRLAGQGRGKRKLLQDAGMIVLIDMAYTYVVKRKPRRWRYEELHRVFRLCGDEDKQRFVKVNRVLKRLIQVASLDVKADLSRLDGNEACEIVLGYDEIELHLQLDARAPRRPRSGYFTLRGRKQVLEGPSEKPDPPNDSPENQVDGAGEDSPLVKELIEHGVEAKSARQVVAQFSEKHIKANLEYARDKIASGNVNRPGAYIVTSIKSNYANSSPAPSLATPDQAKSKPKDVKKEVMKLVYAYQRAQGDYAQRDKEEAGETLILTAKIKAQEAAASLEKALTQYGLEREINLVRDLKKLEDVEGIETALERATADA